jgi:hypothetical protein
MTETRAPHIKDHRELYAMIDKSGEVIGLVLWYGLGRFDARSLTLKPAKGAQIGWTFGAGIFTPNKSRLAGTSKS